jgi:hypothetical protein
MIDTVIRHIYPLGTRRTSENQFIRTRIKCHHVGCKRRIQGIECNNGQFYYKRQTCWRFAQHSLSLYFYRHCSWHPNSFFYKLASS